MENTVLVDVLEEITIIITSATSAANNRIKNTQYQLSENVLYQMLCINYASGDRLWKNCIDFNFFK